MVFFKGANEAFRELVGNLVLHQKACRRDANLTRVAGLERRHDVDRAGDVGVVENKHGGVAAKFHSRPLHMLSGQRRQMLADRGRAGEGDFADRRMWDEILGNLGLAHHRRD